MRARANAGGRRGFARDRSGATAVEFAIVAPVLVACVLGIFNVGLALYGGAAVRSAVERASRVLITAPGTTSAALTSQVQAKMMDVPVRNLSVQITQETVGASQTVARVSWTYDVAVAVPFMPSQLFSFGSSLVVPMAASS